MNTLRNNKCDILHRLEFHRVNKNQRREGSKAPVVGIRILCWSYWKSKCADKILDVYHALTGWSENNYTAFITAFDNEIEINWDDQRPYLTIETSLKGQQQEYDKLTHKLILVVLFGDCLSLNNKKPQLICAKIWLPRLFRTSQSPKGSQEEWKISMSTQDKSNICVSVLSFDDPAEDLLLIWGIALSEGCL